MSESLPDVSDKATELEILYAEKQIKYIQAKANEPIPTSDFCYWCDTPTVNGRRFCNRECADNWSRRNG